MEGLTSEILKWRQTPSSSQTGIDFNKFLTTNELHILLKQNHDMTSPKEIINSKPFLERYTYEELNDIHNVLVSRLKNNNYHSKKYTLAVLSITEKINKALNQKVTFKKY